MKTFIKTLLVAVTILFSVFATAKQVKLPNNIKYVNTTEAFSCTEIDGMNCQTKNPFIKITAMFSCLNVVVPGVTTTLSRYLT